MIWRSNLRPSHEDASQFCQAHRPIEAAVLFATADDRLGCPMTRMADMLANRFAIQSAHLIPPVIANAFLLCVLITTSDSQLRLTRAFPLMGLPDDSLTVSAAPPEQIVPVPTFKARIFPR